MYHIVKQFPVCTPGCIIGFSIKPCPQPLVSVPSIVSVRGCMLISASLTNGQYVFKISTRSPGLIITLCLVIRT